MAKRISMYVIKADLVEGRVTVQGPDGKVTHDLCYDHASEAIKRAAWAHGVKQKIGDAGAVEAGENGKVDPAEKWRRVLEMADRVHRNVWNERAAAGTSEDMVLFRALCLAYPDKTPEQVGRFMEALDTMKKRVLLNQTEGNALRPFVDKVRAELAATAPVDAEELLAGIE